MRVEVVIDELVLIGFDARDKHRIADAITRELAARVSARDAVRLARADGDVAVLHAPDFVSPAGASGAPADAIGAGVGRSIGASLSAPPSGR